MTEGVTSISYTFLVALATAMIILNYLMFIDSCERRRFGNRFLFWFGLIFPMGTLVVRFVQTLYDVIANKIPELWIDIKADIKLLYLKNFKKD